MPVLGLQGTGTIEANERPQNYREGILWLKPRGGKNNAPLTTLLNRLPTIVTDDPVFHWYEQETPAQRILINNVGGYTATATSLDVDDGAGTGTAKETKKGTVLLNERTGEIMRVTADPTTANTITVERADTIGTGTASAAINDNDVIIVVGTAYEEGASLPTATTVNPTRVTNNTQIFRTPVDLTRTLTRSNTRTGDQLANKRREGLERHAIEMEKAFIWGEKSERTAGPDGQPLRTTGGVNEFITTNVTDEVGAAATTAKLYNFLEPIYRFGSDNKLMLAGSTLLNALTRVAISDSSLNIEPMGEVYGFGVSRISTPWAMPLFVINHPLMSHVTEWRDWAFVVDMGLVRFRPLEGSDTAYIENRQNPGDDKKSDEYLTESGLEFGHEKAHGVWQNVGVPT